nr:hypothetical protein CFP56_26305 [Quercus suber]
MKVIENHWALLDLAKAAGITNLIIECDALEAVKLLSNNSVSNMLFNSILNERRNSLQTFHEVKIQHCYREANKAADHLAKAAINPPPLSYVSPPNNVSTILSLTILLLVLPPTEFRTSLQTFHEVKI